MCSHLFLVDLQARFMFLFVSAKKGNKDGILIIFLKIIFKGGHKVNKIKE